MRKNLRQEQLDSMRARQSSFHHLNDENDQFFEKFDQTFDRNVKRIVTGWVVGLIVSLLMWGLVIWLIIAGIQFLNRH